MSSEATSASSNAEIFRPYSGRMSPGINWYEAESNPYMPSGEAWVGPDAVLKNLFTKLGGDWDAVESGLQE